MAIAEAIFFVVPAETSHHTLLAAYEALTAALVDSSTKAEVCAWGLIGKVRA